MRSLMVLGLAMSLCACPPPATSVDAGVDAAVDAGVDAGIDAGMVVNRSQR